MFIVENRVAKLPNGMHIESPKVNIVPVKKGAKLIESHKEGGG